ncbi:phosphoribosyltransferase [Candidatus Uhrbacteria bacterium]|nr:phosphoribosyltransferase [Candidatus Uhrbacteria bacterium]
MTTEEIKATLESVKALITDSHIVYTSGMHGSAYINKDALYPHTEKISALCAEIAHRFAKEAPDAVIAPALGGIILSQWTAHHLTYMLERQVYGVYAEKVEDGGFVIKRGYDKLIQGKKVLVVEDVVTTGGSVKKVIEQIRKIGADVIGVCVLANRGAVTADDIGGVPRLDALLEVTLDAWNEADCLLCKQGIPINIEVGKGREYLVRKNIS